MRFLCIFVFRTPMEQLFFMLLMQMMLQRKNASAKKKSANELCQFCIAIRYSLNFACHKIFLEKLPDFMLPRVKALNKY